MDKSKKKKVLKYSMEGDFIECFDSIKEACESVGLNGHSSIVSCCNMKPGAHSTRGYQWRYLTENYPLKIERALTKGEVFKQRYGSGSEGARILNEKRKETCVERYGFHSPMLNSEVKKKYDRTNIEKYGVDNPAKNELVKKKISKTMIDNFLGSIKILNDLDRKIAKDRVNFYNKTILYLSDTKVNLLYGNRVEEKYKIVNLIEEGIRLFHFFDDEIINKEPIVLSMIGNSVGKSYKIYARKCDLREIPNSEGIKFFEENHIQGGINGQFTYGLFHKESLVSVMSFCKTRKLLGFTKEEESHYELLRFSNSLNMTVVGGASRLLNHFIRTVCPQKITTYANRRWSNGNLYEKIGFRFVSFTEPGYYFFYSNKRVSRHLLTRKSLIGMGQNPQKTTEEILSDIGAFKIWDCGNYKFEMNIRNHETI